MAHALRSQNSLLSLFALLLLSLVAATPAMAQPTFSKVFTPDTIGPGSVSTLTFTIDNTGGGPLTDLAFTDVLPTVPGDVDIATPANASTDCTDALLTTPDGGGTITLSDGKLGTGEICTISVDVTASTPGVHTNTTGDLTSSAGNSGTATDNLTVVTTRPGFSKSFAPSTVSLGGRSTLTFTIDNTLNALLVGNLDFTDNLPAGMLVASPANASTDCVSASIPDTTITAVPGSSVILLDANGVNFFPGFEVLPAGATCTVTVDVTSSGGGALDNVTNDLLADFSSSGKASATLDVTVTRLALQKLFTDDPVPPGDAVTLEFTISNFERNFDATDIAFTDDLTTLVPGLAGLTFTSLLSNDCGGSVSGVAGTTIDFSGGTLSAQGTCTISVSLTVPGATSPGVYTNTTSAISGTIDGSPVLGNMASDDLFVESAPILTKTFLSDPVSAGGTIELEFTVTNTSATSSATDIAFEDLFDSVLATASVTPGNGCCGVGSTCTFTPLFNPPPPSDVIPATLSISGGTLAPAGMAGDSCTFSITLDVGIDAATGTYPNTTSEITATVDGASVTGVPASDSFDVVAAPSLSKEFTDDPVVPGNTVTLEFTLTHDAQAPADATDITFSDDLTATLTGLMAVGLPISDVCGTGSMISGTTMLSFTGGTLAPGATCTFSVTLQVPMGAAPNTYANTTSTVSATVGGVMASGIGGQDNLVVSGLTFAKQFLDNPTIPGQTTTLRFTIGNAGPTDAAITSFTDNLSSVVTGLQTNGPTTTDTCGGMLIGPSFLIYAGGSVMSGSTCVIEVPVLVPPGASDGDYNNVTSSLTTDQGLVAPAVDTLTVDSNRLNITKSFTDDPVEPGDTVTLEFTLTNLDPTNTASAVAFTDDLDAALSGLVATGLPMPACGGTVAGIPDASTIDFSGGTLTGGEVCTFSVTLQVPAAVSLGTTATNTTDELTGTILGLPVVGGMASDDLIINFLSFTKAFDGPSTATGTPTLTLTIENLSGSTAVSGISFTDDLDAALTGLVATGLPMSDVCGTGSTISGTSFLTFSGGSLDPGTMCVLNIPLQVPAGATPGTYPNTTSDLFLSGLSSAAPATDDLVIEPPPTFAKSFMPATIAQGGTSALRFDIDNSASAVPANSLDFTDNLPAGVEVANPPNVSNTCGGTPTAAAGATTFTFSGGSVGAGASCTIEVSVTAANSGAFDNTSGDLTSTSGNSGSVMATLTVTGDLLFSKVFFTNPVLPGGTIDLEFTIINDSNVPITDITFTDDLDATLTGLAATGLPVANVCGAGSQITGTSSLTLAAGNLAANDSCTFSVTLAVPAGAAPGIHTNATSGISALVGPTPVNGSPATADLDVLSFNFSKAFDGPTTATGAPILTFTIENLAGSSTVTDLNFTDDLDAVLSGLVATGTPLNDVCGSGSQLSGTALLTLTGGTLAPGATCVINVPLLVPVTATEGTYPNTTSDLFLDLVSAAAPATDDLVVEPAPLFSKSFTPDVIGAGDTSVLRFDIDNTSSALAATNLTFTDNLPAGVEVANPPGTSTTCTAGTLTANAGSAVVSYTGGSVAAATACFIEVTVTAPGSGAFMNTTGDLTSSSGNSGPASATLTVTDELSFSKTFLSAPVLPGGSVDLEFTITNGSAVPITDITFTDDLDAAFSGLMATGLPANDVCGAGSQITGTSNLTLSGGNLASNASCTFTVSVTVPATTPPGMYTNTTSAVTAMAGGGTVFGSTATADLEVAFLNFEKAFGGTVTPGDTTTLTFMITNPDPVNSATAISFTDDLDAVLPGLVAVDTPRSDICGAGSQITGASFLTFADGILAPGASCMFSVTVEVPDVASGGTFTNVTSELTAMVGGSVVTGGTAEIATADLSVGTAIPTLGTWSLLLLALALALLGLRMLRGGLLNRQI